MARCATIRVWENRRIVLLVVSGISMMTSCGNGGLSVGVDSTRSMGLRRTTTLSAHGLSLAFW